MIQRIQTLFLSVSVISCILLFFFPIAVYINDIPATYKLFVTHLVFVEGKTIINFWATSPMLFLLVISILLSLTAIFSYKKRRLQLLFVNVNILLTIVQIALIFLFYSDHLFRDIIKVRPSYQMGGFIPLISLVFLILAFRAIKKDEALVKSADRLR